MIRADPRRPACSPPSRSPALAENSTPQPVPFVDTIPQPRDMPYPGTMTLDVDATDVAARHLPREADDPGRRGGADGAALSRNGCPASMRPRGEIEKLAGLQHHARTASRSPWTRDPVDVFAFHIDVPRGREDSSISSSSSSRRPSPIRAAIVMTPDDAEPAMEFDEPLSGGLFHAPHPGAGDASTYPEGWTAASAPARRRRSDRPTPMRRPITKCWSIRPSSPAAITASSTLGAARRSQRLRRLRPRSWRPSPSRSRRTAIWSTQAVKLFGAQHYDHYEFLLAITDEMGGIGARASPQLGKRRRARLFHQMGRRPRSRNLLPHEYTHSWDGKFRRGADLWTPDFRTPMRDSLLWVYEGQTQFWGYVLRRALGHRCRSRTRSTCSPRSPRSLDNRPARNWRPMVDTTNDPIISARRPKGWLSWQRSEDYYNEGLLIWMEVDSILREQIGRHQVDRRFRPRLLRHARRRLGRADLHVRRRRPRR